MVTGVDRLLFLPYQLIRRPLAVLDEHAIKKLPSGNPVRELYHAGLRLADGIARVDRTPSSETDQRVDEFDDQDGDAVQDEPTATSEVPPDDSTTDEADEQAEEQRRQEFEAKVDQVTRSNHSPAKMARELAMVRAAEEAREHEAAATKDAESTD